MIPSLYKIFKFIVINQYRQDFAGIIYRLKHQMGLRIPHWLTWIIAFLYQNTLVLLLALFLESLRGTYLWTIIVSLVLLFNLWLPVTMARQAAQHVSTHPLRCLLHQSPHNINRVLFSWLLAEAALFWLHEMSLEMTALYVLSQIGSNFLVSFLLIIFWIVLISAIYISTLRYEVLKRWNSNLVKGNASIVYYFLRFPIMIGLIWFLLKRMILPFTSDPISSDLLITDSRVALGIISQKFKRLFVEQINGIQMMDSKPGWIILVLSIATMLLLVHLWITHLQHRGFCLSNNAFQLRLDTRDRRVFCFYSRFAKWIYPKNPWIQKDLLLIKRLRLYARMPEVAWWMPPAVVSVVSFSLVLLEIADPINFVTAFLFISAIAYYQTIWLWQWNCSVLHPGSELRNINLTRLSPAASVREFMRSKIKLIFILQVPMLSVLMFLFNAGLMWIGWSWMAWISGVVGIWILYFSISILSSWWMFLCTRFDYLHLLGVRTDHYETKIFYQFYQYPRRIIIGFLSITFFLSFFFDHVYDVDILIIVMIFILFLLFVSMYLFYKKDYNLARDKGYVFYNKISD